ncbi:MAG: AmmeMemoRadiSam system protein B [Candidatus Methanoplasma sp.]|jgi:AmmeMemoRadiSam system protein B|nr:AmmeMemoRadiSam system protein B [Candidatus Methanoplasma sp.]
MRYPAVAGRFYPADKEGLLADIKSCFLHEIGPGLPERTGSERTISAAIAPHAGYMASGMNAAHVYRKIAEDGLPEAYILIGPDHRGVPYRAVMCDEEYLTPLGPCKIHKDIAADLREMIPCDSGAHRYEHSVEVQVPFIQFIDKDPKIVPIIMRDQSKESAKKLAAAIKESCKGRDTIIIASSDMAHYIPKEDAERLNSMVLERIGAKDVDGMYSAVERNRISVCGYGPMAAAIYGSEPSRIEILKYSDSWDSLEYDIRSVVGYGSAVMYK